MTAPSIPVPSPQEIHKRLFPYGALRPALLPEAWNAQALFTPFGGQASSPIKPGDQLVVGNVTYDATNPNRRLMRVGLYLLESLLYYDLLFETSNGQTRLWWLVSDPAEPNGIPKTAAGLSSFRQPFPPGTFF
jgi:hypothetical protein